MPIRLVNSQCMQSLDSHTINEVGVPSLVLMENAAQGVALNILKHFPEANKILVVAGKGNNGGDGIATARILKSRAQKEVVVFLPYDVDELKEDPRVQYHIAKKFGVKFTQELPNIEEFDLVVDAIFGTGFKPPIRGKWAEIVKEINKKAKKIVAVDMPSGISSDTGTVIEPVIKADLTITFDSAKYGQVLYPASLYCGKVIIWDISLHHQEGECVRDYIINVKELKDYLPKREAYTYKNREGHIFILGGSAGKTGAIILSAKACMKAGAGLVTVGVAESLNPVLENALIEEMTLPLPELENGLLHPNIADFIFNDEIYKKWNAIVIGPGMGRYKEGQRILEDILNYWEKPLLIDADGINNLADMGKKGKELLKKRKAPTILTPHVGEMQRLTGLYAKEIIENQIEIARNFAVENNCYLVLKSARTVIATPEGKTYTNVRGTPAMAKGGSGDVLSGILGALIGKMEKIEKALVLGVSLHAISGEISHKEGDIETVKAGDLINNLSKAYRFIRNYDENKDEFANFFVL